MERGQICTFVRSNGESVTEVGKGLLIASVAYFCEPLALATGLEGLRYHYKARGLLAPLLSKKTSPEAFLPTSHLARFREPWLTDQPVSEFAVVQNGCWL